MTASPASPPPRTASAKEDDAESPGGDAAAGAPPNREAAPDADRGPSDDASGPRAKSPASERPPSTGLHSIPVLGTFGRYEILGRIALGGMAEIFLARERAQAGVHRTIVLKRVLSHVVDDPRFVDMFLDEARLAMQLRHPNICPIYEFGHREGSYFIAMEWVDGVPLGRLIKRFRQELGRMPPALAARIIAGTAEALDYAHRAVDESGQPLHIVHRDVSPQNIMVSFEGSVKLLDFGIAKANTHATKTSAGQVKGKFAYMSPQQCIGDEIDSRADVFALGVCLYEALTARNLYRRKTEYETMRAIIEDPVPSVREVDPSVPEGLDTICQRALAKAPEKRFQTAAEMQTALELWLADSREVVNSASLASYLGELFGAERSNGPQLDAVPFGVSAAGTVTAAAPADGEETQSGASGTWRRPSRSWLLFTLLALVFFFLTASLGTAAWWWTRGGVPGATPATAELHRETEASATGEGNRDDDGNGNGAAEDRIGAAEDRNGAAGANPSTESPLPPWETGVTDLAPGTVVVRSDPPGARVRVGDRMATDRSPAVVTDVPPGEYPVTVRRDGYETWRGRVVVRDGATASIRANLQEIEVAMGTLAINTRPWSQVFLGSRLLGQTPIGRATVPTGPLRLRLVDRDGQTHERTVQIQEDGTTRVFFDLTRGE